MKYLFKNGGPITTSVLAWASCRCNIDTVKYLYENGAPIDIYAIKNAETVLDSVGVLDYLFFNGAPYQSLKPKNCERFFKIYRDILSSFIIDDISNIIISYLVFHKKCHGMVGILTYTEQ